MWLISDTGSVLNCPQHHSHSSNHKSERGCGQPIRSAVLRCYLLHDGHAVHLVRPPSCSDVTGNRFLHTNHPFKCVRHDEFRCHGTPSSCFATVFPIDLECLVIPELHGAIVGCLHSPTLLGAGPLGMASCLVITSLFGAFNRVTKHDACARCACSPCCLRHDLEMVFAVAVFGTVPDLPGALEFALSTFICALHPAFRDLLQRLFELIGVRKCKFGGLPLANNFESERALFVPHESQRGRVSSPFAGGHGSCCVG